MKNAVAILRLMNSYPELRYGLTEVRAAGRHLAADIAWNDATKAEALETFAIANSWRNSHIYPMRSVRLSLIGRMRATNVSGFTAARPKRMSSIRKKLRRSNLHLDKIQDLAGCRAVLDDVASVAVLTEACRETMPHILLKEDHYIARPKVGGYRSHHMIFEFQGRGPSTAYTGRRVELQIRTRLQHSWATAVEAVGLFRGEDMKAGHGDLGWLRLFQLMSAEFAHCEGHCQSTEAERDHRRAEIRSLNGSLHAASVLEDLKNATYYADNFVQTERARLYLIQYDDKTHQVEVRGFTSPIEAGDALRRAEAEIEFGGRPGKAALVDVAKVDGLIEAYPNYFGDVSLFIMNLKAICAGGQAIEYTMAPQKVVAPKPYEKPDPGVLQRRYRHWNF